MINESKYTNIRVRPGNRKIFSFNVDDGITAKTTVKELK